MKARRFSFAVLFVPLLLSCTEAARLTGPPAPLALHETTTDPGTTAFEHFVADATSHEWANSYLLALLSHFVYVKLVGATGDSDFLAAFQAHFEPLGLTGFTMIVDPLSDTEAVAVESEDAIFIVFRGTESAAAVTAADLIDGYVDVAFTPINGIHDGFQAASRSVLDQVVAAIDAAPGKQVWLTGHSLGGALATVTAHLLEAEENVAVQGVYTYGSPRVFDVTTANAFDASFGAGSQRWVNNLDPVPHVGPHVPLILPYQHVRVLNNIVPNDGACMVRRIDDEHLLATPEQMAGILALIDPTDLPGSIVAVFEAIFALGDLADHDTARYASRIYASMPVELRALLPEPPYPATGANSCDGPQDDTPPVITSAVTGTLGSNNWYVSDVNVSWSVVDEESDIEDATGCTASDVVADTDGVTFTCSATSTGGTTTESVTVKRDATAPIDVAVSADRAPDHDGWYSAAFTATWTGSDATSGLDTCSVIDYTGPDIAAGQLGGTCSDLAGNSSGAVALAFRFDATAPIVAIVSPPEGTPDYFQNQSVIAEFGCTDVTSGVASCAGSTANGALLPTGSFGAHELAVMAADQAGNTASVSRAYTVTYGFDGFYQPVQNLPIANVARAGRSIPFKWNLLDASGSPVADRTDLFHVSWGAQFACDAPGVLSEITSEPDSRMGVRWDPTEQQYVFVAATDPADAGMCRYLNVDVGAHATVRALVRFR